MSRIDMTNRKLRHHPRFGRIGHLSVILTTLVLLLSYGFGRQPGDVDQDGDLTVSDVVRLQRMLLGIDPSDTAVADLNGDARVDSVDLIQLLSLLNEGENSLAFPGLGGVITAEDGAAVIFPVDFGEEKISVDFSKTGEPESGVTDERIEVSARYILAIDPADAVSSSFLFELPIRKDLLPTGDQPMILDGLSVEELDPDSGLWVPIGDLFEYDPAAGTILIDHSWNDAGSGAADAANTDNPVLPRTGERRETRKTGTYQVKSRLFSSRYNAQKSTSKFKIYFYMPDTAGKDGVKGDAEWNSTTGNAFHAGVPDYVEDLDVALNSAYDELQKLLNSGGTKVFDPQSEPMSVCIQDLGEAEGQTKLGGSFFCDLYISSHEIAGWPQMKAVAAHELVHLLQGKYYGALGIHAFLYNRWFVEATANHFAAAVSGLTTEQKKNFYGEIAADYLSVSMKSSSEASMYSLADFLDWLQDRHAANITGDALAYGSTDDLVNLTGAIQANGGMGITSDFGDYVESVIRTPEKTGDLNAEFKDHMSNYSNLNNVSGIPRFIFSDRSQNTYLTLKKTLQPLSASYVRFEARLERSALLVIDSSPSDDADLDLLAYDFIGSSDSDYSSRTPISNGIGFRASRATPITVESFGEGSRNGLEYLVVYGGTVSRVNLGVNFYVLVAPEVLSAGNNKVAWSTKGIGNIPRSFIRGYNIYRNNTLVNTGGPVPFRSKPQQEYTIQGIQGSDSIVVAVIDKFGNSWPEVDAQPAALSITGISPTQGAAGTQVTITGTGFGAARGSGSVRFKNTPVADYISWSETRIVVKVPQGAETGKVSVQVNGKSVDGPVFTIVQHQIDSFTPTEGPPGEYVYIYGSGFGAQQGDSYVTFGGGRAKDYPIWTDGEIVAKVPSTAATGDLVVTVGGVSVTGGLFTVTGPKVTDYTPKEGRVGDEVTITGSGFGNYPDDSFVSFGGVEAVNYPTWEDGRIVVEVPEGAQSGELLVVIEEIPVTAGNFNILAGFEVTSVSAMEGRYGDDIVINGKGFTENQGSVAIGDLEMFIWSWSNDRIEFQIGEEAVSGDLKVTVQGVSATVGFFKVNATIDNPGGRGFPRSLIEFRGSGFGAQQGGSSVSVGGVTVSRYRKWDAHYIEFWVPDEVSYGDQQMMVTISGVPFDAGTITIHNPEDYFGENYPNVRVNFYDKTNIGFGGTGIILSNGSSLEGVGIHSEIEWSGTDKKNFSFSADYSETSPDGKNTETYQVTGLYKFNDLHPTVDIQATYTFDGIVDGKITKITRTVNLSDVVMQPEGEPGVPVWDHSNYALEGQDAKIHTSKVYYKYEQEGSDPVTIDQIDWNKIRIAVSFQNF